MSHNPIVHYDQLNKHCYTLNKRVQLSTLNLRNFNNERKRELISRFVWPHSVVWDLCGGKGGDLQKFEHAQVREVNLIDASAESIKEAERRYEAAKFSFVLKPKTASMFTPEAYPEKDQSIDVVSCQFALHYAFCSDADATYVIRNVARALKPRGLFLITTPNETRVKTFRNNSMCKITMNLPQVHAYKFWLKEAVDAVEYLVPFDKLVSICKSFDLVLVHYEDYANIKDNRLRWDERAVASLYCEYAFQKQGDHERKRRAEDFPLTTFHAVPYDGERQKKNKK